MPCSFDEWILIGSGVTSRQILVVDDEPTIRELLVELLTTEGYVAEAVANGWVALEWLRAHHPMPCLVLLDMMMPVMDGRQFLSVIEEDSTFGAVPVVVITAHDVCKELRNSPRVVDCIQKPLQVDRLLAAIEANNPPPPTSPS